MNLHRVGIVGTAALVMACGRADGLASAAPKHAGPVLIRDAAEAAEYLPQSGRLAYADSFTDLESKGVCGATAFAPMLSITAAHCVYPRPTEDLIRVVLPNDLPPSKEDKLDAVSAHVPDEGEWAVVGRVDEFLIERTTKEELDQGYALSAELHRAFSEVEVARLSKFHNRFGTRSVFEACTRWTAHWSRGEERDCSPDRLRSFLQVHRDLLHDSAASLYDEHAVALAAHGEQSNGLDLAFIFHRPTCLPMRSPYRHPDPRVDKLTVHATAGEGQLDLPASGPLYLSAPYGIDSDFLRSEVTSRPFPKGAELKAPEPSLWTPSRKIAFYPRLDPVNDALDRTTTRLFNARSETQIARTCRGDSGTVFSNCQHATEESCNRPMLGHAPYCNAEGIVVATSIGIPSTEEDLNAVQRRQRELCGDEATVLMFTKPVRERIRRVIDTACRIYLEQPERFHGSADFSCEDHENDPESWCREVLQQSSQR